MDFCICRKRRVVFGGSTAGWIGAWVVDVEDLGRKCFPVLVWPQIVCDQQVVEECAGSGVGAQLLNPGLSELCHPDDCLMGLQNHAEKGNSMGNSFSPGCRDVCLVAAVVVWAVPYIPGINTMLRPSFALLWCFVDQCFYPW